MKIQTLLTQNLNRLLKFAHPRFYHKHAQLTKFEKIKSQISSAFFSLKKINGINIPCNFV
jgi:hypothetical protein